MWTRLLERIEDSSYYGLLLMVGLLVITCQLIAVGSVASDQVRKHAQREQALVEERAAVLRCLERPGRPQGCQAPQQAAYRPEVYTLGDLASPIAGVQRVAFQTARQ